MKKDIEKWADQAMFTAEPSDATGGPRVYLLAATADPLGAVAAAAKMYKGEVVRDYADVTDQERSHYLEEMKRTKLAMPLEAVNFHFLFDGVTRAFTHQLVRQRTAAYSQESMRFAVVEDSFVERVALPPSLAGTKSWTERVSQTMEDLPNSNYDQCADATDRASTQQERWRRRWDEALDVVQETYRDLVNDGMPAEDARGLMPTNITTRVNYFTNLRGLLDHAGNRLCTQAQFEWRLVFAQLAKALREYPADRKGYTIKDDHGRRKIVSSQWQFDAIADLLRPACYQAGRCVFAADFDRKCSIRDRVDAYADRNVPSSNWENGFYPGDGSLSVSPIKTWEWLADPSAAR